MQTVADLDNAFRLYVDKADSQGSADFLPGERQRFLNDAQLRLCRELTDGKTDNQDGVDLRRSLSTYAALPITPGVDGADQAVLPVNYLAYGRCRLQLRQPYAQYTVKPNVISEDEFSSAMDDEFNGPSIGEPVACFLYNTVQLYPSGAGDQLLLSFYRLPTELDLAKPDQVPDLVPALLPTLVQYAVQLALESVNDARFQTQAAIAAATAKA